MDVGWLSAAVAGAMVPIAIEAAKVAVANAIVARFFMDFP